MLIFEVKRSTTFATNMYIFFLQMLLYIYFVFDVHSVWYEHYLKHLTCIYRVLCIVLLTIGWLDNCINRTLIITWYILHWDKFVVFCMLMIVMCNNLLLIINYCNKWVMSQGWWMLITDHKLKIITKFTEIVRILWKGGCISG